VYVPISISLKLCLYLVPFLRYSASKNGVTLNCGRGRSRTLEIAPFDRPYTTFYWSAIVYVAVSGTVLSYLTLKKYRYLEIWVIGH